MDILITGASGRLGSLVLKEIYKKFPKANIFTLSRKQRLQSNPNTTHFKADITNKSTLDPSMFDVDVIINTVGLVNFNESESNFYKVNTQSVKNILDMCKGSAHIIQTSTISVYGKKMMRVPADEFTRPNPDTFYSKSKFKAEELIRNSGFNYTILRLSDIYGPNYLQGYSKVISLIKKKKMLLIGNGNNNISLIHQSDAVLSIVKAIEKKRTGTYIISNKPYTQKYLFNLIADELNVPKLRRSIPVFLAKLFIDLNLINIPKEYIDIVSSNRAFITKLAQKELDFKPLIDIRSGISQVIEQVIP